MTSSNDNQKDFIGFLSEIATGTYKADSWEQFVVTHYPDPNLERARIEFVQASIAAGDWLPPEIPVSLCRAAEELHSRLASNVS